MRARLARRAVAGLLAAAACAAAAADARAPVPAAGFWIDWRRVPAEGAAGDAPGTPQPGTGLVVGTSPPGTGLVVGTRHPVPPGWSAVRSGDAAPATPIGSVRATNGVEAALRLVMDRTTRAYDHVWTAQGQGVVSHDDVHHEVRELRATPRWSGGAEVALALSVADGDASAATTLRLPFDTWTTVARLAPAPAADGSGGSGGSGGTGAAASGDTDLQVRVRRR